MNGNYVIFRVFWSSSRWSSSAGGCLWTSSFLSSGQGLRLGGVVDRTKLIPCGYKRCQGLSASPKGFDVRGTGLWDFVSAGSSAKTNAKPLRIYVWIWCERIWFWVVDGVRAEQWRPGRMRSPFLHSAYYVHTHVQPWCTAILPSHLCLFYWLGS